MHFSDSVSARVSPIFLIVLALSLIYFIIIDEVTIFCASKVSMHRELDGGSIYFLIFLNTQLCNVLVCDNILL